MSDRVDPRERVELLHRLVAAFEPILDKIDEKERERAEAEKKEEAAKKQQATGQGATPRVFE